MWILVFALLVIAVVIYIARENVDKQGQSADSSSGSDFFFFDGG